MLDFAIKKAVELSEQYHMYAPDKTAARKCEKAFLWCCGEFLSKKIEIRYLPAELQEKAMLGTYIRKHDHYVILLATGMTEDIERFVLVKELFHIILDQEGIRMMDMRKHLEATLFGGTPDGTHSGHALSEYATHVAAAEFLFPFRFRKQLIDAGRRDDLMKIAQEHDIPRFVVEHYMSGPAMDSYDPEKQ